MADDNERYVRYVVRTRFLSAAWVDPSKLRLTYEGAYSLTPAAAAGHMVTIIERELRRPLRACRVLECFAGHGGDTIPLMHFGEPRSIVCFETNPVHRGNLRHNLRLYFPEAHVRRRITVSEDGDAVTYVRGLSATSNTGGLRHPEYDVVYMDPPWGGHAYKETERIADIELRDRDGEAVALTEFVAWCFGLCRLLVLKLPINFDAGAFACYRGVVVEDVRSAHIRYVLIPGARNGATRTFV